MYPNANTAPHNLTCRECGSSWPCHGDSGRIDDHEPNPIPTGAVLTTAEHVTTLIEWTIGGAVAVVIDRHATPWLLFANEDGDQFAVTVECPDDDLAPFYDPSALPADRGPLLLVFNGDASAVAGTGMDQ